MWMKETPRIRYSDWAGKNSVTRPACEVYDQFIDVPNYRPVSKHFDVRHLDKFISKVNNVGALNSSSDYQTH